MFDAEPDSSLVGIDRVCFRWLENSISSPPLNSTVIGMASLTLFCDICTSVETGYTGYAMEVRSVEEACGMRGYVELSEH